MTGLKKRRLPLKHLWLSLNKRAKQSLLQVPLEVPCSKKKRKRDHLLLRRRLPPIPTLPLMLSSINSTRMATGKAMQLQASLPSSEVEWPKILVSGKRSRARRRSLKWHRIKCMQLCLPFTSSKKGSRTRKASGPSSYARQRHSWEMKASTSPTKSLDSSTFRCSSERALSKNLLKFHSIDCCFQKH